MTKNADIFKSVVNKLWDVNFSGASQVTVANIRTKEMAVSQQLSNLTKYHSAGLLQATMVSYLSISQCKDQYYYALLPTTVALR